MTKVKKGNRKRAYKPKTSTGCQTCRIRRIKCDETQPVCLRCKSTGRTCDGSHLACQVSQETTIVANPPFESHVHASPQAHRSFAFFVHRTCPQLAGFFGSDFWERLVLQAAYHEPAIRHAIVAIGSLHELFEQNITMVQSNRVFALEQYNLAINKLLVPITRSEDRGVDVCLISCILFTCVENMQGYHFSAISHLKSGAKLLGETLYDRRNGVIQHQVLGSKSPSDCYVPLETLAKIFSGLGLQDTMMSGGEQAQIYDGPFSNKTANAIPLSFSSVEEAKYVFEYGIGLFNSTHVTQFSADPTQSNFSLDDRMAHFADLSSRYTLALDVFIKSKGPSLTPKEKLALDVLQLHILNARVILHFELIPVDSQEYRCNGVLPLVREILDLGEKIITSTSSTNIFGDKTTSFCLDMGYIIPIYTVASQCQDPILRRRAIALLRSAPRQEGIWNSILVAKAAERITELEESGMGSFKACLEYPNQTSTQPFLEMDARGGRLQYIRGGKEAETQINVVEEIFTW